METRLRLGKRPATTRPTDFRWAELGAGVVLPTLPYRFGHANIFQDWLMLGNGPDDSVAQGFGGCGDCVFAGAAHEHRMYSKIVHRRDLPLNGACVVADYSDVTGYVVGDENTDNGTDVSEALAYRRKIGIRDANGNRHKIGAYVALDPKNWNHLLEAVYIFGAVGIGFEFPEIAWDQFDAGIPWDTTGDDGPNDGGHYVPVMGTPRTGVVGLVTWAKRQEMTRSFYETYNDESWVYITDEALKSDGTGLHGFDLAKLNSYLSALKG